MAHAVTRHLHDLDPSTAPGRSLTGVTLPVVGGGVTVSSRPAEVVQWREQVGRLLDVLEAGDTSLLITVDEVHKHARGELRDLAATLQHLVRGDRNVALAVAGLPAAVSDLLNDDVLTFLRRSNREELDDVALVHVAVTEPDSDDTHADDEGDQNDDDDEAGLDALG